MKSESSDDFSIANSPGRNIRSQSFFSTTVDENEVAYIAQRQLVNDTIDASDHEKVARGLVKSSTGLIEESILASPKENDTPIFMGSSKILTASLFYDNIKIPIKRPVFERVIFCKLKVVKSGPKLLSSQMKGKLRKSFWIYPQPKAPLSANEKDEADLLTSFGLNQIESAILKTSKQGPLSFISHFFASFKPENGNMFVFALNKNQHQSEYENQYNWQGQRYFYGFQYSDFEIAHPLDKVKNIDFELDVGQGLILIESRYPFRSFFHKLLTILFNEIRFKRLELFASNYNGNEHDSTNLSQVCSYDSSCMISVVSLLLVRC